MRAILTGFFCISSLFLGSLTARAEGLPVGVFKEMAKTGTARVETVIDPETIQLDDKTILRLSGITYPDLKYGEPGTFSMAALKILKDMLEGKTVNIYQTKKSDTGRVNRMGHQLAQLERQADKAWVQGTMLMLGLAAVETSAVNPEMAPQMYVLEQKSILAKAGVWAQDEFKILTPQEANKYEDSERIVEGKIRNVALKNNRVYLNFGVDWRSDFTVSIAPEHKRAFSKTGMDLQQLNGKTVRVRGWIRDYNGPAIEIDHPQALEVINQ